MNASFLHGAQQAVDQPGADVQTYPELMRARRCRLVVVGVEVGGRFGARLPLTGGRIGPGRRRRSGLSRIANVTRL